MTGGRNRDRGSISIAIGLAIAVLLLSVLLFTFGQVIGQQQGRNAEASYYHKNQAQELIAANCAPSDFDCVYEAVADANSEGRAERDLIAQQGMQFWTVGMVLVALVQTIVAGSALWFLREDLRQNRRNSEAQLRAYISIGKVTSKDIAQQGGIKRSICVPLVNTGATPVLNWSIRFHWQITGDVSEETYRFVLSKLNDLGRHNTRTHTFGAGQKKPFFIDCEISNFWADKVEREESNFYLIGAVDYTDIFGAEHVTEFFYRYNKGRPVQFGQMPWHNRMT